MEKSSEKVIPTEKIAMNPFNNLLSEVQLKINKPKSSKKIENHVLQIDSNIDKSNSNVNYFPKEQKKNNIFEVQSKKSHNNVYIINAPLRTKHSSDTLNHEKNQKEIITQWIIGFMSKRHLLGTHWEHNFQTKKTQLLNSAFYKIKSYKKKVEAKDRLSLKIFNLQQIFQFVLNRKKKDALLLLKQFYKDDQLFGLSNTLREENNSLMLRIQSDYQGLSISSPKFKKQSKRQQFGSSSSSNNNITRKRISESGDVSEDLSALILNHNKLQLSEELNKSNPNLPKSKNSQKNIKTHKQITQLQLQTKRIINSQRKLGIEEKIYDLPLQSNKQLIKTQKELKQESNQNTIIHHDDKNPVTITFVMKNLNPTNLINDYQSQHKPHQIASIAKISVEQLMNHNIAKQKTIRQSDFDQNLINKLPFAQSFYQPAYPKNGLITFIQPQNPKRSTSLQIKYNNPISIQKNEQISYNNISSKRIINHEYYPQENNRQNQHFVTNPMQMPTQKVRPKSATPKITFTFSNSNSNLHINQLSIISKKTINSQYHPQYDQQDCVLQSIINAQPIPVIKQVQVERKHKLQIISPSRRPDSPKRTKIPQTKMTLNQRQHIKNIILPPFNDYCDNQKSQKQNCNMKLLIKDNQLIYHDKLQTSTAQNSLFSPRQSTSNRLKSPKDKIFVTYPIARN